MSTDAFEPIHAPIEDAYELLGERAPVVEDWDRHVLVDVVHDGVRIPPSVEPYFESNGALRQDVQDAFVRERDWGSGAVAERLAYHLGLRGYHSKQAARVVCDYNRFRGRTVEGAGHLGRRALFPPGSELLPEDVGETALRECFDPVSNQLFSRVGEAIEGVPVQDSRLLRITVHTYDDRAGEGHRRPKVSLIFTPFEYHEWFRLPTNVYPPVFPDRLAEFTADRALAYRMALMLEKNYLPVAVNSPYFLPLGGAEMRLQVWCYMQHLQRQVERFASDADVQAYEPLWPIVCNVDEPWGTRDLDPDVLRLVDDLETFVAAHHEESVLRYRYSAYRPNAIEVEVRKDIIWKGEWQTLDDGSDAFVPYPDGLDEDEVDRVAAVMASGVREYLVHDQPEKRAGANYQ